MEFKNGYKLVFSAIEDGELVVKATKTTVEEGVEVTFGGLTFAELVADKKLIYVKDGDFYASETGIPSDSDEAVTVKAGEEIVLLAGELPAVEEPSEVEEDNLEEDNL